MALLGLTEGVQVKPEEKELTGVDEMNKLCEDFEYLDDESAVELEKADFQNASAIARKNAQILKDDKTCKKWVKSHAHHAEVCKYCKKGVAPSIRWKFWRGVWYRWSGGRWHYYGPSRNGYGGNWRWSGGYWHYKGYAFKYVNGRWYRFYNGKWNYYKRMIPINPSPPKTPKYCVRVYHMERAGIPTSLQSNEVPRCQVGKQVYMWNGERSCKILGGRKIRQKLFKCKSGSNHKWRLVTRCTGGDIYRPQKLNELLSIRWKRIGGSAVDIGTGGG